MLLRSIEQRHPDMICSILLLDAAGTRLWYGAQTSLPEFYTSATDGLTVGEGMAASGTTAFRGERVVIEDIMQHPYFENFRAVARQADLRSCWSEPIFDHNRRLLGTFVIYHRQPNLPDERELVLIESSAQIAALAIVCTRAERELHIAAAAFETHEGTLITDGNKVALRINQAYTRITGYSSEDIVGTTPPSTSTPVYRA